MGTVLAILVFCCVVLWQVALKIDAAYPPPLPVFSDQSVEVVDREGKLLRVFANSDGRWRLETDLQNVDLQFIEMLIAYEDKRFYSHLGVDPFALLRAAGQFLVNGRIVSGGSTITMQLARLLEPRSERSMSAKLRQILRAFQLERRLSKNEILTHYLTLAPFGGNLESVRAASLSWFGREPHPLALEQAALLVALPQSPEARRPDRFPEAALAARQRVLKRMVDAGLVINSELSRIAEIRVPGARKTMPALAAHLAESAIDRDPVAFKHSTTLDRDVQRRLEIAAAKYARKLDSRVSLAILAADALSGEILASVGSPGYLDEKRAGWIDMTLALRSPGSTLKPLIYGLAIEEGLALPETLIADRPSDFNGYRPANFDMQYQGEVSVRKALQLSLNIPAIRLLDALGPAKLVSRMRRAGVRPVLPEEEKPGLSIGLGGAGLSLHDLVQLYANLATGSGRPIGLGDGIRSQPGHLNGPAVVSRNAAWHVGDMLSAIAPPISSPDIGIAYKTGTSYGYRDAWAVGYNGKHVIGVWVGRPDNGSIPGITGLATAAPLLFTAFQQSGLRSVSMPEAPAGTVRMARDELPASLKYFTGRGKSVRLVQDRANAPLAIAFPPDGAELDVPHFSKGQFQSVVVKLQGGKPPFRIMANGTPETKVNRRRNLEWQPDGMGVQRLTIIDADGETQSIEVTINHGV
ncbi:MAG: penicillin-binding protein 1C [Rhizobiaceae bacterium]